jgi:hypothetical protein
MNLIPTFIFILFALMAAAMGVSLYRALKTGRILFGWYDAYVTFDRIVKRKDNPSKFWGVIILYCICIIFFLGIYVERILEILK